MEVAVAMTGSVPVISAHQFNHTFRSDCSDAGQASCGGAGLKRYLVLVNHPDVAL
jgi:hypothetical protein